MEDELMFIEQLERIKQTLANQLPKLKKAAELYADAIESGGLIHAYVNGHSRIAVEEMVVRWVH